MKSWQGLQNSRGCHWVDQSQDYVNIRCLSKKNRSLSVRLKKLISIAKDLSLSSDPHPPSLLRQSIKPPRTSAAQSDWTQFTSRLWDGSDNTFALNSIKLRKIMVTYTGPLKNTSRISNFSSWGIFNCHQSCRMTKVSLKCSPWSFLARFVGLLQICHLHLTEYFSRKFSEKTTIRLATNSSRTLSSSTSGHRFS